MIDLLIVTGGSKGIGKNIALNSSKCAKKVLAIGSSDLINDVLDRDNHIYTIKRDISRIDNDFDELSDFLKKHNPSSIGLVLCASKLGNFGGIADADFMDWENLYRTNVLGNLSVLNNILKFANINTKEDYVLWLKITLNNNTIFALKDNLTKWRKLNDSLSSSKIQKFYDGYLVYRKYMNFSLIKSYIRLLLLSFNHVLKELRNK